MMDKLVDSQITKLLATNKFKPLPWYQIFYSSATAIFRALPGGVVVLPLTSHAEDWVFIVQTQSEAGSSGHQAVIGRGAH